MTALIQTQIRNATGHIILDRPKALNSLSLAMVRDLTHILLDWRDNAVVKTVIIRGSTEKAFCAGGDIRFFHQAGGSTPRGGSAALDDFFTEEYALNHLIHFYPKPWIAVMDGIVMGGGMGLAQSGPQNRLRIVTERTKMAMPEVNIGLFPDVGGSYFLSRTPGQLGTYLGVSGEMIAAADALYAGLADVFLPGYALAGLEALLDQFSGGDVRAAIRAYAAPFASLCDPAASKLAQQQASIDTHFRFDTVTQIADSLAGDDSAFAQATLATMQKRSPLMMAVTLRQLRQGAAQDLAGCLRMERTMVRHAFTQGEVLEGIRAVVIDKDNQPHWQPAGLEDVTQEMVDGYFAPVWPDHAHPLRHLIDQ